jgi:hypothetical protein
MFGVIGHLDGLVDEKYRDAVLDAVRAAEPSVVEELARAVLFAQALIGDQQERPAVFRADEDAQQLFVEHDRQASRRVA